MVKSPDGSVTISVDLDSTNFKNGLSQLGSQLSGIKASLLKVGAAVGLAFSAKALIDFGKKAVDLGSDIAEVQNVVDTAFGSMAYKAEEFADTAIQQFGMSKLAAKKTASTYMAMASGMGMSADRASDMAVSLAGLTGDVASFFNISQELADVKLKSVFTGETESLKDLGIVMTQTNLDAFALANGFGKTLDKMTQAEQVELRYQYVTKQLALAQGDFAKTSDSWANQTRILSENWKEFMSVIGQALITVLTPALRVINSIVASLVQMANVINKAVSSLFGGASEQIGATATAAEATEKAIEGSASGASDLAKSTEKAGKAAKGALASFDELNVLSSQSGSGSSSGSVGAGNHTTKHETSAPLKMDPAIEEALLKIRSLLEPIQQINFEPLKESLGRLADALKPFTKTLFRGLEWAYLNLFIPLSKFTIEEALPRFFDSLAISIEGADFVISGAQDCFDTLYQTFLKPVADYTGSKFLDFWDRFNDDLKKIVDTMKSSTVFQDLQRTFEKIGPSLSEIVKNIEDLESLKIDFSWSLKFAELNKKFKDFADAIGLVAALLDGDFSDAFGHLKNLFLDNWIDEFCDKMDAWKERLIATKEKVTELATEWESKLQDTIDTWTPKVTDWWENDVKPWFTLEKWKTIFSSIGEAFGKAVEDFIVFWTVKVPEWWENDVKPWFTLEKWKDLLSSIWKSISTTVSDFSKEWSKKISDWWTDDVEPWFSLEKWKQVGQGIIDGLVSAIKEAISSVTALWDSFWSGFSKGKSEVEATVSGVGGKVTRIKSTATIPRLAQGAVIPPNREFMAVLGDQKQGTNIEAPLETIKQALAEVMAQQGGRDGGDMTVILELDNREFGRAVVKSYKEESKRVGVSLAY